MTEIEAAYIAGIIDGEGSIMLTKLHSKENRRPIISVASTDIDLLQYIRTIVGGKILSKRNYNPGNHRDSFTLVVKNKKTVLIVLETIIPHLRVPNKYNRAKFIVAHYERVTIRNGRYNEDSIKEKNKFEEDFFRL